MIAVSPVEVTVKCRIGVDDQDPEQVLPDFLARIAGAGVRRVTIHARKAWLQGLSPKENREIRQSEAERKAAALPPKLTVPMIVFFLPVLFAVILTPALIQMSEKLM